MLIGPSRHPVTLVGATIDSVDTEGKRTYIRYTMPDGTKHEVMVWCGDSIFEAHADKYVSFTVVEGRTR